MTRKNLITEHYHNKSKALFHATMKLQNADVGIHSIDFDRKRINIERPTPEQVFKLGVSTIIAATAGRTEANINGFTINWDASKTIIEIKGTGVIA